MIQLRDISLDLGSTVLFEHVDLIFQNTDRVGIIGRNGAGKSTLLKIIAGRTQPTSGNVIIEKDTRIAYLPQEEVLASSLTVFDEALSAFAHMFTTQQRIADIEQIIAQQLIDDRVLEEYAQLQAQAQNFNKHIAERQTHEVLAGLGFTSVMIENPVSALSTGWKMRLALAKLLLTDADVFLFDEPTNHLDIVTQQWLLQKMQSMPQGFLLVSHDRAYLEQVCTSILEIERSRATYYRGNLKNYLIEKQHQLEVARATRAQQDREIAQKQKIIDRFKSSASRAQQAKNLTKQIQRIELVEVEPPLPTIKFHFPTPQKPGSVVLQYHNLSYEFNGRSIFKSISGEIQRDERVALIAANGVGKTTLINCLAGKYIPLTGKVTLGHGVKVAFFEQDQAQALSPDHTVFEEVQLGCPQVSDAEIRTVLGSFQFSGDDVYKKIKVLSGGEKNRVAMTKVLLQRANFLILDEPTNHLDLYAKDVLCQALQSYEGTILFVSHDLDFVNKVATSIIELTPTSSYRYPGTYQEFCQAQKNSQTQTINAAIPPTKTTKHALSSDALKIMRKQITELERTISKLEQNETKYIEALGAHPYGSTEYNTFLTRLNQTKQSLAQVYKEWEEAMQKFEDIQHNSENNAY